MGGKVIRTAMVTVTHGGPKRPEENDKDTDAGKDADIADDASNGGTADAGGDKDTK